MDDPWLIPWLPLLRQRSRGTPILELGCGDGRDSATLSAHGLRLDALDCDPAQLILAQQRLPQLSTYCQDLRAPWPDSEAPRDAVLASLCLHYFSWAETVTLVARIHAALRPGGVLLCRLNSTADQHFGASGHPELERHFYLVDGQPKRFFDQAAISVLFARGWQILDCREQQIDRYALPKTVWEIVLEKIAT